MSPAPTSQRLHRGLTLLEVIVSISIISILLTMMATFFWRTLEVRDIAAAEADRTQIARQVLDRIAAELRSCVGFQQLGFPVEQRLVGGRREITFLTAEIPEQHQYQFLGEFDDQPPAQHDLTQIHYRLWVDPEELTEEGEPLVGGILRVEKKTLNQLVIDEEDPLQLRTDLWSHELGYIEFRYFDGIAWTTQWDITEGNSLPQMVQVTVGYESCTMYEWEDEDLEDYPIEDYPFGPEEEHPDRYTVLVRLPAADQFFGSRVQRLGRQLSEQMGVEGMP